MKTYNVTFYFTEGPNADEILEVMIDSSSAMDAVLDGLKYRCFMLGSGFATVSEYGFDDNVLRIPFRKDR